MLPSTCTEGGYCIVSFASIGLINSPSMVRSVESVKSVKWSELIQLPEASFAGWRTIMWIFTWPYRFVVFLTIPDPLRFRKLYPLTFVCCIGWIGVSAYLVFWMISVIGNTFGIPDTVMGMTFLAFGGCMPEAASAVTLIRRGRSLSLPTWSHPSY